MSGNDRSDFSASASIEEAEDSTQGPSRKDRKRARKAAKRAVRDNEDRERLAKRASMLVNKSQESLRTFISCPAMSPHSHQLGSVHLNVPKWDTALLVADCAHLMSTFVAGTQFGDTHDGLWQTLSLRSSDGTTSNDSPSPSAQYLNTDAWHASSYIVPNLLHSFGPTLEGCFERVRLSVVPPSCNVAWHCDYTHAEKHVTRLHIPILCSNGFEMDIGGTIVSMEVGESYIGNFELPHRLSNTAAGTVRVHLIVDIMMPSPTAIIAASATAAATDGSRASSSRVVRPLSPYLQLQLPGAWCCTGEDILDTVVVLEAEPQQQPPSSSSSSSGSPESAIHFALIAANALLEGDYVARSRRTACIEAFSNYRWSQGDSVATQSSVEKGYYSHSANRIVSLPTPPLALAAS